ncbi:RBBP9/YdeN family alpha/beta hydrolase [Streptomyces sp. NPDC058964]|uniref:RBBP9/YdeN family alpha/beta hydrolase n=1 Tax=Streptomyces sp. NPDC058964 TaxID=3346681 RepID=UPI003696C728
MLTTRVVLSHAWTADPGTAWYPHLAKQLRGVGHEVRVPQLPEPMTPRREPWREALAAEAAVGPAEQTVLVGHSLGGVNVLRLLEQHDTERDGAYAGVLLVATPARSLGFGEIEEFFDGGFDHARIRRAAGQVRVLIASDDPVLGPDPLSHVREHVETLGATVTLTPTGGHFSPAEQCTELPSGLALVRAALHSRN